MPSNPTNSTTVLGMPLTPRELEAINLLVQGCTDREIAEHMGISKKGAESHLANIRFKAGINRRVPLALWWVRGGTAFQAQDRKPRKTGEHADNRGSRAVT